MFPFLEVHEKLMGHPFAWVQFKFEVKLDGVRYITWHSDSLDKKKILLKIVNIFLPMNFSIFLGCSKELSH